MQPPQPAAIPPKTQALCIKKVKEISERFLGRQDARRETPAVIYLDMNIWVALARGCIHRDARWEGVREGLRLATREGRAIVPLSAANYLELWHRSDETSREHVGAMMRDISGYATIQPPSTVRRKEIEARVSRFRNSSADGVASTNLLGYGATNAFGSPYGRFRFVESLATDDGTQPEGPPTGAPDGWEELTRQGAAWEWIQLVGTQRLLELDGLDRTPEHRNGSIYLHEQMDLRKRVTEDQRAYRALRDKLAGEELISLLDDLNEICEQQGVDPTSLFFSGSTTSPPEAVHAFINELPSANTWVTLRLRKHQDLTHPWDQHDWTDLSALSVAVPYCDAIFTEKRWAHLIEASGLARRYATTVGHSLSAIELLVTKIN